MSSLEVVLAIAGFVVTTIVVAGMILITPHGQVPVSEDPGRRGDADLSPADADAAHHPAVTDLR